MTRTDPKAPGSRSAADSQSATENGGVTEDGGVAESGLGDGDRFGPWLRSQREMREITLREIADSSKISKRYLEALEAGKFEGLPAAVFTKGFLRQYARYVGLDPEEVLSFYESAREDLESRLDEPEELQLRRPPAGPSNLRYVAIALLVAAIMLAAVWALTRSKDSDAGEGAGPSSPSLAANEGAVDEGAGSPPSSTRPSAAERSDGEGDDDTVASDVAESVGPDAADDTGGADGTAVGAAGPAGPPTATRPSPAVEADGAPLVVTIDFSDNCWVEAWSDGERTIAQLEVQGESLRLSAQTEIRVKVGDINATRFEVNGMPYDPPVETGGNAVRQLTFDAATVAALRGGG